MIRPTIVALITMFCGSAMSVPAAAQEIGVDSPKLFAKMTAPAGGVWQAPGPVSPAFRGQVLPSLYVSFIGLEMFDGYSTSRGLSKGAIESNTVMSAVTSHQATLWATKGAVTLASIYVSERLWRHHRRGQAIAVMLVSNGLMAAVAASNASVIRTQK